ncbi:hypothetical protein GQ457_02G009830 [Hibiscus cannabinus]
MAVNESFVHDDWPEFYRRDLRPFELLSALVMLSERGIVLDEESVSCVFCGRERDEIEHIFFVFFSWSDTVVVSGVRNGSLVSLGDYLKCIIYESQWWECPLDCSFPVSRHVGWVGVEWVPSVHGVWKFNVDGSTRGKPGLAGCGGVLRDDGVVYLRCFLFRLVYWILMRRNCMPLWWRWRCWCPCPESVISLVVESDSVVAISRVLHREYRPWCLVLLFHRLDTAYLSFPCVCFSHVLREANDIVNYLAKAGVDWSS